MSLTFVVNPVVKPPQVTSLLKRAELERPAEDAHRLARIHPNANIIVGAYDNGKLIGLARGLKEMSGCCYLSDLIVDRQYHNQGIGESLIRQVRAAIGDHAMIMLVAAEDVAVYNTDLG